jgi:hypothetical protein
MATLVGTVGPVGGSRSQLADGTNNVPVRMGRMAELMVSELHGRYYEQTYRGNVFSAANQAAVATVALGTTTYTGLAISNNNGNPVNLSMLKVSWVNSVAVPTAGYLALETGFNMSSNVTHTTPGTVYNHLIGAGNVPYGTMDVAATLPTAPVHRMGLTDLGSVATTAYGTTGIQAIDLEGSIILPPGAYVCPYTFATNTVAWFFSASWEEVPI